MGDSTPTVAADATADFNSAVKALRGKVVPKQTNKKKAQCTPQEWAAAKDYMDAYRQAHCERLNAQSRERYSANRDREVAAAREYRRANRHHITEQQAAYRAANKERIAAGKIRYREENSERVAAKNAAYYQANREKISATTAIYRQANKDHIAKRQASYYEANKRRILDQCAEYRARNSDRLNKQKLRYRKARAASDPCFALSMGLRNRLHKALMHKCRSGSSVRDCGMTMPDLRKHLESMFKPGWSWENWGDLWHLDHTFPLAAANLGDRTEFLAVNNWRNLRPLSREENIRKGDKITPEAQALFDELVAEFKERLAQAS